VVELWNLGSSKYVIHANGTCDEPLRYPQSPDLRSWSVSKVNLDPTLRLKPRLLRWKIHAEHAGGGGLADCEVGVQVRITKRITSTGKSIGAKKELPPDGPLSFICRVE
jgi:hypothetical protein